MGEIADVQEPVTDYAERKGWLARRMQYIGRRACPDTFLYRRGVTLQIEFKAWGKLPDALQRREHRKLARAGIKVHVIDSFEKGKALIDSFDGPRKL